jgi:hypothetical protein
MLPLIGAGGSGRREAGDGCDERMSGLKPDRGANAKPSTAVLAIYSCQQIASQRNNSKKHNDTETA